MKTFVRRMAVAFEMDKMNLRAARKLSLMSSQTDA